MTRKFTFGILLCICLLGMTAGPLRAQHWDAALKRAQKAAQKAARKHEGNINKALQEGVARARAVNKSFKQTCANNDFANTFILFDIRHPTRPDATAWALKENQTWLTQRILHERALRQLSKTQKQWEPFLKQEPVLDAQQLARLIPPDKKYVFMGEYHEDFLSLKLQQTVVEYTRLHPHKQVLVFSEFAPDRPADIRPEDYAQDTPMSQYVQHAVPWMGLEEAAPSQIKRLIVDLSTPANVTLQGIAARNAHWIHLLKAYRQKYPDAVFFIHSGSLHSDYQEPYAVSNAFAPQESFVMQFISYSRQMQNYEKFHLVTRGKYLCPGTLIWQKQKWARTAGFDVQAILPLPDRIKQR